MKNTFKVLFYCKKNAPLRNGDAPIVVRITVNGERTHVSSQLAVDPRLWDVASGQVAGRSARALCINERLACIRYRIERCYHMLSGEQRPVTARAVKERYLGNDGSDSTLLAFFRSHNDEFLRRVGVSRSKATYYKYRCVCNHLACFIDLAYRRPDLPFRELDREFLIGFHRHIAEVCRHKKNTIWVYMIAFKHVLKVARSRGYMTQDLFADYKLHSEFVERNYLSMSEVLRIVRLKLDDPTLQRVRDAFLFSCFTGLSYVDLCTLTSRHIRCERNTLWISMTRQKTGADFRIRLFSVPYAILHRYGTGSATDRIFVLPSNGWCNACLDRIRIRAGIERRITFHAARHTFATTVTLSQGMAIETISQLLGHRNIRTTQIYASVTHSKLDRDLDRLSKRLDALCRKALPEQIPLRFGPF